MGLRYIMGVVNYTLPGWQTNHRPPRRPVWSLYHGSPRRPGLALALNVNGDGHRGGLFIMPQSGHVISIPIDASPCLRHRTNATEGFSSVLFSHVFYAISYVLFFHLYLGLRRVRACRLQSCAVGLALPPFLPLGGGLGAVHQKANAAIESHSTR
jgi:hypothetical protein